MTDHHVVEHPAGGWAVRREPEDREVGRYAGQDAAIRDACARIRETGGGELAVQDRRGRTWHRHAIGARRAGEVREGTATGAGAAG